GRAGRPAPVRPRCQKVVLPAEHRDPLAAPEATAWLARLDALPRTPVPALLDWAEEFRGQRAPAAAQLDEWLALASAWLRRRIGERVEAGPARGPEAAPPPGLPPGRAGLRAPHPEPPKSAPP